MMPTDVDCAGLCAALYATISGTGLDHFDLGADDGICWGLKHGADTDVVVLRGSETKLECDCPESVPSGLIRGIALDP